MWKPTPMETELMQTRTLDVFSTYTNSVDQFRNAATEFLQHVDLLSQARGAYEQALATSAELRTVLDLGDETIRGLMAQLERSVNDHLNGPSPDKKRPELVKSEANRENGEKAKAAV